MKPSSADKDAIEALSESLLAQEFDTELDLEEVLDACVVQPILDAKCEQVSPEQVAEAQKHLSQEQKTIQWPTWLMSMQKGSY